METFFEVSGLNVYLQIAVTLISISVHLLATRNKQRKESVIELAALYTICLAGWFSIISGVFGYIIHAIEQNNFSPSNTGIVVYWDFLLPILLFVLCTLYRREQNVRPSVGALAG